MSSVTNTILAFSISEAIRDRFDDVNKFFAANTVQARQEGFVWAYGGAPDHDRSLESSWVGGSKMLSQPTFVAAFNHLNLNAFVEHIRGIQWKEPYLVQLIVCNEDDEQYRIIQAGAR